MRNRNKMAAGALACVLGATGVVISTSALADDAGAFIGGVFATKLLSNMSQRTQAEQAQAQAAQRQAQPVAAAPAHKSTQQRLDELDKLAAGGYITPEEYKTKKKAILDSM